MRLFIVILGSLACALHYGHRAGLSVAIVSMAKYNSSEHIKTGDNSGTCLINVANNSSNLDKVIIRGEFEWSESMQGLILGASYYPYLITPTISGRIAERFGAKWMTAVSVITPAILLSLIPTVAYHSLGLLLALLVVMGLFHGCIFSALFSMYNHWFTPRERTYATAAIMAGSNFGNVITYPLAGYLSEYGFAGGWPSVFYVITLAHIPWIILWLIVVEDTPLKSNTKGIIKCSDEELKYIQNSNNSFGAPKKSSSAPWKQIFTSKCVWAAILSKVSGHWGYYLLLSKMPAYLDKVFGISLVKNGLFNSMTSLSCGLTNALGGPLSAYIITKTESILSKTRVRKLFETIALIGPAICLAIITYMDCDSNAVISLLIIALLLYGLNTGGDFTIIVEFAPDYSGTVFGLAASIGVISAIAAPYTVGVILGDRPGDKEQWNIVWYITIGIYIIGALAFELMASAETQEWGIISKEESNENKNKVENINMNEHGGARSIYVIEAID